MLLCHTIKGKDEQRNQEEGGEAAHHEDGEAGHTPEEAFCFYSSVLLLSLSELHFTVNQTLAQWKP